jgi:hypothetical protein
MRRVQVVAQLREELDAKEREAAEIRSRLSEASASLAAKLDVITKAQKAANDLHAKIISGQVKRKVCNSQVTFALHMLCPELLLAFYLERVKLKTVVTSGGILLAPFPWLLLLREIAVKGNVRSASAVPMR